MSLKKWTLDSCPCILLYDDVAFTFVNWEARCNEHRGLDGQPLFDGVLAHNQSFNNQYTVPPTPTREEVEAENTRLRALKTSETSRIERAGATETR